MSDEPAHEAQQPHSDDFVPVDTYLDMTGRLIGRIQALETALHVLLSERTDLADFARRLDDSLIDDEASRIRADDPPEETMQTHEWARQAAQALMANAARRVR